MDVKIDEENRHATCYVLEEEKLKAL